MRALVNTDHRLKVLETVKFVFCKASSAYFTHMYLSRRHGRKFNDFTEKCEGGDRDVSTLVFRVF